MPLRLCSFQPSASWSTEKRSVRSPGFGFIYSRPYSLACVWYTSRRSVRQPSSAEATISSTTLSDNDAWHTSRALRNVYFPPPPPQLLPPQPQESPDQPQQGEESQEEE